MNLVRTAMLLAVMTALFMAVGFAIGGRGGMMIAFVIAAGMNFFSYWYSDRMVLRMYRAQEVDERSAPEYYGIVRDLAENAGLPMPRVYVIDNPQPNAFATGRNPQNAAVAASTGLLNALSYDEVAGVMAHELAHVQNRDTLTMTLTATLAGAISMLGNFAFLFGGNRENNNNNNPLGFVGVLIAMIVAPMAAMLVQMAISRTREYSADRRGAEICGKPWLSPRRCRRSLVLPIGFTMTMPSATRQPRICSSSIRSQASAWTTCFRPIRTLKTGLRPCNRWRRRCPWGRRRRFGLIIRCANRALFPLPVGVAVVPNRRKVPGPDVCRKQQRFTSETKPLAQGAGKVEEACARAARSGEARTAHATGSGQDSRGGRRSQDLARWHARS